MEPQTLPMRYTDYSKLLEKLAELFAAGTFSVDTQGDNYVIQAPRHLNSRERASVRVQQ